MGSALRSVAPVLVLFVALSACTLTRSLDEYDRGPSGSSATDAGFDAADDASADTTTDVSTDVADDAAPDALDGAQTDAEPDVGPDGESEAGCPSGFSDCDDDPSNGCETDTRTALEHCGACNAPCSAPSGDVACVNSSCAITHCPSGTADCNGATIDGCEVNVMSSSDHCGGCGRPCPPLNAVGGTCTAGTCAFTCTAGFADCDADALTGCEVELATDPDNCGVCANACTAPPYAVASCVDGLTCAWSCEPLRGDCDADELNGCERNVSADEANCGACGNACPASFDCLDGLCACSNPQSCDYGGGGKCSSNGSIKVCECGSVKCEPGEVCLPGELCGTPP